eukprot:7219885-Alexandrium_andersonii.AAC.1
MQRAAPTALMLAPTQKAARGRSSAKLAGQRVAEVGRPKGRKCSAIRLQALHTVQCQAGMAGSLG